MRKGYLRHLGSAAIEHQPANPNQAVERPVLSLEEEVAVLAETADLQQEVAVGLDEAARVEDTSDNLLDLADSVEANITELTPQQAALIDTAAEMAVAGTDTDPDDVIPSMEGYIGKKFMSLEGYEPKDLAVAIEGFRETADRIWKNIREFVESLWAKIRQAYNNLFAVFPRQLNRIKMLRDAVAEKRKAGAKDPKSKEISIVVGTSALSYPGYLAKNAKDLTNGLSQLDKLAGWTYGSYASSVKSQGDVIAEELRSFDPRKAAATLESVRKKVMSKNFSDVLKSPPNGYMGRFDIKFRRLDPKKAHELSDNQVVSALRHTWVDLVKSNAASDMSIKSSMQTLSLQEIDSVLGAVEKLVKQAGGFENSASYKAMLATKDAMKQAGDTASANFVKEGELSKTETDFAVDVMRSLMNFNTVYTKWASDLPGKVTKRVFDAVRASLVVCEKSLAQY